MKIALIGHKVIPSREGGVEVVVEELATRYVKLGHDVTAYNRKRGPKTNCPYKGIKIVDTFTIDKKSLDAVIYSFCASVMVLFKKYDVIHYHALGPSVMLIIPKIFKRNTKIVATVHGLDWQRAKWGGFGSWYLKLGEKIIAKYADEVIVLSENNKKYFKDKYNRDVTFIPNGIVKPEPKQAKLITKKYGLKKDEYILFLSRIVPEKGLDYLIEAFSKINTNKKLVIAGGSSHTPEYYNSIVKKTKNMPNVILTGHVEGRELEELYSNTRLYVLPSEIEGMPMTLLEAISYNAPVLTSDIKENIEVSGKENSFKSKNVNSLKTKLENILNSPKKENAIDISKYDWDKISKDTINLYLRG